MNGNAINSTKNDALQMYTSSDPSSTNIDDDSKNNSNSSSGIDATSKRLRTFSETLKLLDDDIIADLK